VVKFLLVGLLFAQAAISSEYHGRSFPDGYQVRAFTSDYRIHCFTRMKCPEKLGQLLTEKFKANYDKSQYQVVVYSQLHQYSDGGGVGMAFAGVAPLRVGEGAVEFPIIRYTMTIRSNGPYIDNFEAQKGIEKLAIDAVKRMMDECEKRPRCDVYQSYD
jgi:hypothetical protein